MESLTVIARNNPDSYKVENKVRKFTVITDEPSSLGGSDLAPTPMEYLYIALASCVATTLRMYIQRKKWNLGTIEVNILQHENDNNTIRLTKQIKLGNPPSQDQIVRLTKISEKCPVSKMIDSSIEQVTEIL